MAESENQPRQNVYKTPIGLGQIRSIDYFNRLQNKDFVERSVINLARQAKKHRESITRMMAEQG